MIYYVISKSLGGIETSKIIGDPTHKKRINTTGRYMLKELLKNASRNFPKTLKKICYGSRILNSEVMDLIKILEDETLGASMAMLGNTAFALSKTPDTSIKGAMISKIDSDGCKFL